jgi:hypothetical protein
MAAEELKKMAGTYASDELGVSYQLQVSDEKLKLAGILISGAIPRSSEFVGKMLVPVAKDEFRLSGSPVRIRFQRDSAGQPVSFTLDAGRTKGMIFRRTSGGA